MKDEAVETAMSAPKHEAIEEGDAKTKALTAGSGVIPAETVKHDGAAPRLISWDILAYIGQIGMYRDLY